MADWLPTTDEGLEAFCVNFSNGLNTLGTAVGITTTQVAAYLDLLQAFQNSMLAMSNPAAKTKSAVVTKDLNRAALKKQTRALAGIVQEHPTTTDTQRSELGLTIRKTSPTPQPTPDVAPGVHVEGVVQRKVFVRVHDSASSTKRGKPKFCVASYLYYYIGDNYPTDPGLWEFAGAITRPTHELELPDSLPGGTQVWITACWINAKQESGPMAAPVTTNVQGGGNAQAVQMKLAA